MVGHIELAFRVRIWRANNLNHYSNTTGLVLFTGAKSKTIHLPIKQDRGPFKRDREHLTVYTSSLWFYRDNSNWTGMDWLGSMSRGKGKKGRDGES